MYIYYIYTYIHTHIVYLFKEYYYCIGRVVLNTILCITKEN